MLCAGHAPAAVRRHFNALTSDSPFTHSDLVFHIRERCAPALAADDDNDWFAGRYGVSAGVDDMSRAGVAAAIVRDGLHAIQLGRTAPSPRDLLVAAKELSASGPHEDTTEEMVREFKLFAEAVKSHVPEAEWALLWTRFENLLAKPASDSGPAQS